MMNETLGRGYARIDTIRTARGEPLSSAPHSSDSSTPPPDKYHTVYVALFVAGAAFLLPFNSFIMAVDYFQHHYPNSTIMFDISTVYIVFACIAVVINNLVIDLFSYNTRITSGILISLSTMIFVAVCNIGWDGFSKDVSYRITLVALAVVAFGCTIQQASYYGFTGYLPPRYTQAVMVGESAAGFWVSLDRIATKYTFRDPQRSTFMFFVFTILILLGHSILHHVVMKDPLIQHYLKLTAEARNRKRIHLHLNPNEDANLMENGATDSFGVLKLQSPVAITDPGGIESKSFSFANPVYSPSGPAPLSLSDIASQHPPDTSERLPDLTPDRISDLPSDRVLELTSERATLDLSDRPPSPAHSSARTSYKVEDVIVEPTDRRTSWKAFKQGVWSRWVVARAIYPYMVCIGLVYFTTLSLYPGISSEVPSCRLGTWMPIVLMSSFNLFDFLGKIAAAWPYEWSRSQLLMASGVRLLLVPLMLLCAAPRHSPHIVGDVYPIAFSVILGFSNGLFGSVPMIMAPSRVSREYREIAGNMMTLSYNGGLLSGALVSYLLRGMLGSGGGSPCRVYPTPVLPTLLPITTTTVLTTTFNITNHVFPIHLN